MEHESVIKMWEEYLKSIGEDINSTNKSYTSWYFFDNEKSANNLAELVKSGIKRGTSSLYYWYKRGELISYIVLKYQFPRYCYSCITY